MRLAKDNDVVQAFAPNGPNQSLGIPVLPRRMGRNRSVPNSQAVKTFEELKLSNDMIFVDVPQERFNWPQERFN
jgi:hypothetical protein